MSKESLLLSSDDFFSIFSYRSAFFFFSFLYLNNWCKLSQYSNTNKKNPGDTKKFFYGNHCFLLKYVSCRVFTRNLQIEFHLHLIVIEKNWNILTHRQVSILLPLFLSDVNQWVHWKSFFWLNRIRWNQIATFHTNTMDRNCGKPFGRLLNIFNIDVNQLNCTNSIFKNMNR